MSKGRSLALVAIAYLVAVAVAGAWLWLAPGTGRLWLDTLVADLLARRTAAAGPTRRGTG
jgi:hypothetical protein